jgi:hypothetical protein
MNDEQRRALVEEIEGAMHEYADVYERAMHGFTWNQKDVATAKNQAVGAILADIAARALSDEVVGQVAGAIGGGGPQSMDRCEPENVSAAIRAIVILMAAIGITESEAEG